MRKIKKPKFLYNAFCFLLLLAIIIAVPVLAKSLGKSSAQNGNGKSVLNIWQIDCFEGGRGSRADYLQTIGNTFAEKNDCYVKVVTISSVAARENLNRGTVPDLISFGAGIYGLENYLSGQPAFYNWCNGAYCFLTTDESADFSDISAQNTIINAGTENLSSVAALLCGVNGADTDKPTGAYVKLLNGKYKYLLGTQRDVFRLKTRGVSFKVQAITQFNDLYQNIAIITNNPKKQQQAKNYIEFLLSQSDNVKKVGLLSSDKNLYDDEMKALENLEFEHKLVAPVSLSARNEIISAATSGDVKKLKNLLK